MNKSLDRVLYCSFQVLPSRTSLGIRAENYLQSIALCTELDVMTIKPSNFSPVEQFQGAQLLRIPVGEGQLPARVYAFERALRRHMETARYRVVHFTDPYGGSLLCSLQATYGYRLIYEALGFPSIELGHTHPGLEEKFIARMSKQELFCLLNADAVVVGCEQTASFVRSRGVPRQKITMVPTVVGAKVFSGKSLEKPDRTPMKILYLGNHNSWQGITTLLSAMTISTQLAPMRLILAGECDGVQRQKVEKMVMDFNLQNLVEYIELTESTDWNYLLSSVDIGVAPLDNSERNRSQGAPVGKIACYLTAGRPVLAADLPMVREIADAECISFHSPEDENDLAEKLVELARNPLLRVAMGEKARWLAKRKLSAEQVQAKWKELYASLLGVDVCEMNREEGKKISRLDDVLKNKVDSKRPSFQYLSGGAKLLPESGKASDEWLGHVLFGYSPLKRPFTC